jgi:hydrogenase maturation protein HypF
MRLLVRGAVQGVGLRPLVFKLAEKHGVAGWIQNNTQGVHIEVEGSAWQIESFLEQFQAHASSVGVIHRIEAVLLDAIGEKEFAIRDSEQSGVRAAWIMPDLATCSDCLRELFDPGDRRHRYPFLNCTQCGPRFSIIERLPYDRPNTTMRQFRMCAACQREYDDPGDRRFHAQPIACRECGPKLELWNDAKQLVAEGDNALARSVAAIRGGTIVAVKGLGGFQLLADARQDAAVRRLRDRKGRAAKPFALMYPSLECARRDVEISTEEARLLQSRQAPIVLLRRRGSAPIAASVAPGNPYLGVMLPYTPLHHLLMADLGLPIVATSGNRSDEPIAIDEHDAVLQLQGIADVFLVHNRPIVRPMDDSVVQVVLGRDQVLRRARGYAPLPIALERALPPILAVGGHLKNTVAVAVGSDVFMSQHVGDLETDAAARVFEQATRDLPRLYVMKPVAVACDLHPDYHSTRFAENQGLPIVRVQHHVAHILACMAENNVNAPALGVAWDGAGYGTDGTIWGGEFFHVTREDIRRVACLRPFPLPGGDAAAREPRRAALGLLYAWLGDELFSRQDLTILDAFTDQERELLAVALRRGVNAPLASSIGRLCDAAAALAGVCFYNRYEGQAAMEWEWRASDVTCAEPYRMFIDSDRPDYLDWRPLLEELLADLRGGVDGATVSARFHGGLIEAIIAVARRAGERHVLLTGGCFLNRRLLEGAVRRLTDEGFTPYWHQRIPPGDGGIALGQIVAAAREWEKIDVPGSSRQVD